MLVNKQTAGNIIRSFPKYFELCDERVIHNKVQSFDFYRIIPKGRKCFLWFKKYNDSIKLYVMEYHKYKRRFTRVYDMTACFSKDLTIGRFGTICYGTMFRKDGICYFTIEDVMYHMSTKVYDKGWNTKLRIKKEIVEQVNNIGYGPNSIILGVPIMGMSKNTIFENIQDCVYDIYALEFVCVKTDIIMRFAYDEYMKTIEINSAVFLIKPQIKSDVYDLYYKGSDDSEELLDIAFIPDYKTSVYMNGFFRSIKENANLDALEESDDEDEFENIDEDKFVFMDREVKFECKYSKTFQRWIPMKKVDIDTPIVSSRMIFRNRT